MVVLAREGNVPFYFLEGKFSVGRGYRQSFIFDYDKGDSNYLDRIQ